MSAERPLPRVLFVCVENSCRSQMAEGFARAIGGASVEVYSAGSNPSGHLNPRAVESMARIGCDLRAHSSKSVAELPVVEYDVVVTMGCGDVCPVYAGIRYLDWDLPDPSGKNPVEVRRIRDEIERKTVILLDEVLA